MFVWRRLKAHLGLIMLLLLGQATAFAEDFLPPEQAFAFSYATQTDGSVKLHWDIAPGYHLYILNRARPALALAAGLAA